MIGVGLSIVQLAVRQLLGGTFSPIDLFANGEQGVWYDPSDFSTLYQDAAGTTPVTAVEQPVGLMLDKSKGLVLGPELVTNGTFDTDTSGWTAFDATLSIVDGKLRVDTGIDYGRAFQAIPVVAGKTYLVTATVTNVSGSTATIVNFSPDLIEGGDAPIGNSSSGIGSRQASFVWTAPQTRSYAIRVQNNNTDPNSINDFDNISVRELPGNHAFQTTSASRPVLKASPPNLTFDAVDDLMQVTLPAITGTMVLGMTEGTAAYGVSIPAGSFSIGRNIASSAFSPGKKLVGQIIRDGSLSPAQIEQSYAYLEEKGSGPVGADAYAGVTNFSNYWRSASWMTDMPAVNTSSGIDFSAAWYTCSSLTSFPLLDTSNGTIFSYTWYECSSLTSLPLLDTSNGTAFNNAWTRCSSLTSFPLLDTSSGINFSYAWENCSSLTSFPLLDTSSGTRFISAWRNCSSLTSFPSGFFDNWNATPANNCFVSAWLGCNALTNTSVENILTSIDTSGKSAPVTGVDITISYNAATGALTSPTATAITNLKSRGWTVTINGVLQ